MVLFQSFSFLLFFLFVLLLYYLIPRKRRWILLLLASYYFYLSFGLTSVLFVTATTLITYYGALFFNRKKGFLLFWIVLSLDLGALLFFKYLTFFFSVLDSLFHPLVIPFSKSVLTIAVPIGISFYTFHLLSYLIDVYTRKINPEHHLGLFATYILFFPKILSGPIERPATLIPQLKNPAKLSYENVTQGAIRILVGFVKKLVIADRLALVVNRVYGDVGAFNGVALLLATIFFGLQLYMDFSGYTDISLGLAHMLGLQLSENFKRPYFARSVADFWRRWHITLSQWFQDYVFTPVYLWFSHLQVLQRVSSRVRHFLSFSLASVIGMTLLGLWHGSAWHYVLFGSYYGVLIAGYYLIRRSWDKQPIILQVGFTFFFVTVGWILFRANSIHDVLIILQNLTVWNFRFYAVGIGVGWFDLLVGLFFSVIILLFELYQERHEKSSLWTMKRRRLVSYCLALSLLFFGIFGAVNYIYFKF